jgi:hypothetical protein
MRSRSGCTAITTPYWYVKERDFEPASPRNSQKEPQNPQTKSSRSTGPSYGAFFAATQETWFGQSRTRTIVKEDRVFNFASPADKARWQAAGLTTYPVHQGRAIPATAAGTEAYEAVGWTNQLGTPAS